MFPLFIVKYLLFGEETSSWVLIVLNKYHFSLPALLLGKFKAINACIVANKAALP